MNNPVNHEMIDKSGSKTTYRVSGLNKEQIQSAIPGALVIESDGEVQVNLNNKRERYSLDRLVENINNRETQAEQCADRAYNHRYLKNLEYAHLHNLRCGKAWICTERDIQTKGALPEWEGQLICYVYE